MNHDVVIVGAGFTGLKMAAALAKAGIHDFVVVAAEGGRTFDEQTDRWTVRTADGEPITANILILTTQETRRDETPAYLGVAVAGLPNLFLLPRPNMIRYIMACLRLVGRQDARRIEVRRHVQQDWAGRWRAWRGMRKPDPHHYVLTPHNGDLDETHRSPAVVTAGEVSVEVQVHLAGHVQPIDGSYRWYGRIAADPAVAALHRAGRNAVTVQIFGGFKAQGRLTEIDPWGNVRVTGTGRPPFRHP